MKLESNYIRTTALGVDPSHCYGASRDVYKWKDGKCLNVKTGKAYSGDQKQSNCQCLYGNAPASGGWGAVREYAVKTFLGGGTTTGPMPQPSVTTPNLLLPAVAVVGGVALLLIAKKKK